MKPINKRYPNEVPYDFTNATQPPNASYLYFCVPLFIHILYYMNYFKEKFGIHPENLNKYENIGASFTFNTSALFVPSVVFSFNPHVAFACLV